MLSRTGRCKAIEINSKIKCEPKGLEPPFVLGLNLIFSQQLDEFQKSLSFHLDCSEWDPFL